jgi:uncharacterized protein YndB with AHSA1/START domain
MKKSPLVIKRLFKVPVTRLWKAITDVESMKHWYFDIPDFKPEIGTQFSFPGHIDNKDFTHHCVVTDVVPIRKIAYTMVFAIDPISPGLAVETHVSFELEPEGNDTWLTLVHEGLENFPEGLKWFAFDDFVRGWGKQLDEKLNTFLTMEE